MRSPLRPQLRLRSMPMLFNLNLAVLILVMSSCHRAKAFCPPIISGKSRRSSLILGGEVLTSYPDGDNLEKFSLDVKKVLKEIRSSKDDPTISALYTSRKPSFTDIWDNADWDTHTSRRRYIRYMIEFPTSRLLRRIAPQMTVFFLWSCIAITMCSRDILFARIHMGLTPLSLISTFVAGLLTLRSNKGLSRLKDARNSFGEVVLHTREMGQLIGQCVYPVDHQMGLLAARHVAIFGFVLKAHLRGTISSDVINVMLPSPSDASYISSYTRKAPAAILVRLRQIFEYMDAEKKLDKEVRKALIQTTYKLNEALMTSERIRNTPIPPIYTAHTTRLLLFYLFWLPLALYGQLHDFSATLVVTLAVGYSLLGLDEISHIFELPFRLMPLYQLSKMAMMDSADAIVYRPPPIGGDRNLNFTQALPIYW